MGWLYRIYTGDSKENDIVFRVATSPSDENTFVKYNVSRFLRTNATSDVHMDNLNSFIKKLDKQVHVDASDPRYSHIYHGVDIIMKRLTDALAKADSFFAVANLLPTGSIHSNVKVGLPHETDYLLEVPEDKVLDTDKALEGNTIYNMVVAITESENNLTEGLANWTILGVKCHYHICGIALIMQCPSEPSSFSKQVGVTVDLVPAYMLNSTNESINVETTSFLPFSLHNYANQVYKSYLNLVK